MSREPADASPAVRAAFREVHERLDRLGSSQAQNLNLRGQRHTNAGDAVDDTDYVTLRQLEQALGVVVQQQTAQAAAAGGADTGGGTTDCTDDGTGQTGCELAGSNGHATGTLTAELAGKIICGCGNEFPALLAPTADAATRDANITQLLSRMIWHLQLSGFVAGKQRNPSGVISNNKLTVQIDGGYYAYDVIVSANDYTVQAHTGMSRVCPADYVADAGTAD